MNTFETIEITLLKSYENNPRTHSFQQIKQIQDSINEFGFTNPILVDRENVIIAGHGRLQAAKNLGITEIPCYRLSDLTDLQKKAYVIADNQLALNAGWDEDLLKAEIEWLVEADFDTSLLGFADIEAFDGENGGDESAGDDDHVKKSVCLLCGR